MVSKSKSLLRNLSAEVYGVGNCVEARYFWSWYYNEIKPAKSLYIVTGLVKG